MLISQIQIVPQTRILSNRLFQNIHYILVSNLHKNTELEESAEIPPSFAEDEEEENIKLPPDFFNKSRLLTSHRKMLLEKQPYDEPHSWIHLTEKYQRKMFGRYGMASNVNPRICFPTPNALEDQRAYNKIAYPYTLQEMIKRNKLEKENKLAAMIKRDEEIGKKIEKLDEWKKELRTKIAKKEADATAAKERKERLIEEVRRHFGFKVDPRDDKFKELLEQKEREDRKKQKEAKRKAKEDKMMAKLVEKVKN